MCLSTWFQASKCVRKVWSLRRWSITEGSRSWSLEIVQPGSHLAHSQHPDCGWAVSLLPPCLSHQDGLCPINCKSKQTSLRLLHTPFPQWQKQPLHFITEVCWSLLCFLLLLNIGISNYRNVNGGAHYQNTKTISSRLYLVVSNIFRPLWSSCTLQLDKSKGHHVIQILDISCLISAWEDGISEEMSKKAERDYLGQEKLGSVLSLKTFRASEHIYMISPRSHIVESQKMLVEENLKGFIDHKSVLKSLRICGERWWEVGKEEEYIQRKEEFQIPCYKNLVLECRSLQMCDLMSSVGMEASENCVQKADSRVSFTDSLILWLGQFLSSFFYHSESVWWRGSKISHNLLYLIKSGFEELPLYGCLKENAHHGFIYLNA